MAQCVGYERLAGSYSSLVFTGSVTPHWFLQLEIYKKTSTSYISFLSVFIGVHSRIIL